MWLAAHAPERVDRLVPICTSTRFGPPEMWRDRAAAVRANGLAAIADAVVARWLPPDSRTPASSRRPTTCCAATPDEGYASRCEALEVVDLEPDLARITAPTLVVAGALDDPPSPPAHAERIAAGIAGARVTVVPGARPSRGADPSGGGGHVDDRIPGGVPMSGTSAVRCSVTSTWTGRWRRRRRSARRGRTTFRARVGRGVGPARAGPPYPQPADAGAACRPARAETELAMHVGRPSGSG